MAMKNGLKRKVNGFGSLYFRGFRGGKHSFKNHFEGAYV